MEIIDISNAVNTIDNVYRCNTERGRVVIDGLSLSDKVLETLNYVAATISENLGKAKEHGLSLDDVAVCRGTLDLIKKGMTINTSFLPYLIKTLEAYQKMEQEGVKLKC